MTQIDLEDLPRPQAPKTALRTRAGERLVSDLIGTGGQAPAQPVRPSPAQEPSGLRRRWRAFKRWMWRFAPDAVVTKRSYRHRFGRDLDLENPQGLSEKIQWLKLNGMTPLHSRCSDKIAVRDYVAERVGSEILIPMVMATYDVAEITPENIPAERFVVKPNHDSGSVVFCRDRASFDWADARRRLRAMLKRDFHLAQRERQYEGIRRGLIVEELLEQSGGGDLIDYKIYCFHGKPTFAQVDLGRHSDHRRAMYDLDWRKLPERIETLPGLPAALDGELPRPEGWEEMKRIAAILAKPFPLVRIDFYNVDGRVFFGEMTFTPGAGLSRFEPREKDVAYGRLLDLSKVRRNG